MVTPSSPDEAAGADETTRLLGSSAEPTTGTGADETGPARLISPLGSLPECSESGTVGASRGVTGRYKTQHTANCNPPSCGYSSTKASRGVSSSG